jgi:hypothetical protein
MSVFVINSYLFGGPDPEAGLTLTTSFAEGATIGSSDVARNQNAVFACNFTVPASPSGLIYEQGGNGVGTYVGFRSTGEFVLRAGNGNPSAPTAGGTNHSVLYVTSGQPSGTGTLVWEYKMSGSQTRAWWNGISLGTASASVGWLSNLWAGADSGLYFGNGDTGGGVVNGEQDAKLPATNISSLRYYQNQLVSL